MGQEEEERQDRHVTNLRIERGEAAAVQGGHNLQLAVPGEYTSSKVEEYSAVQAGSSEEETEGEQVNTGVCQNFAKCECAFYFAIR